MRALVVDNNEGDRAAVVAALRVQFPEASIEAPTDAGDFNRSLQQLSSLSLVVVAQHALDEDPFSVLRSVRARHPYCAALLHSATTDVELPARAIKAGFDEFTPKLNSTEVGTRFAIAVRAALAAARERRRRLETEQRYRDLFEGMLVGLYQALPDGQFIDANPAFLQIAGFRTRDDLTRADFFELFADERQCEQWRSVMKSDGAVPTFEVKLRRRDGSIIWVENNARAVYGPGNVLLYYEGSLENITERKWTEERLNILAHYDTLTGLPNRVLFKSFLEQAMLDATRDERLVAVLFVDLDRFKFINDTLGHEVGDVVLKAVAARLLATLGEGNTLARLSGDEFGIALGNVALVDDVTMAADLIMQAFSQPFYVPSRELFITPSIGITLFPFDEQDPESLIKNAEVAMYRAKERGRNGYQYYSADMSANVSKQLTLMHALRRALDRDEFQLYYQPQVHLESGEIIGMEALLRWRNPKAHLVPPVELIGLAEETGLILPVGEWVLRAACEQTRAWQDAGLPPMRVAVNLSARQFQQPHLVESIERTLAETGLAPEFLELEITESVLMQNTDATVAVLRRLNELGVHLAIDDFGTGYSSLSYLKRFPIGSLKIDQSFVRDIPGDRDNAAIATAIIAMAHSLGLKVVAEGVENKEQLDFMREHRGEIIQGYYFSRPLPAEAFADLMQRQGQTVQ